MISSVRIIWNKQIQFITIIENGPIHKIESRYDGEENQLMGDICNKKTRIVYILIRLKTAFHNI